MRFELAGDADSVYVQVYDRHGEFITDIQAGSRSVGAQQITWDGRDANGMSVDDGPYSFTVMAVNTDGTVVDSKSFTTGRVTGIDYRSGSTHLLIDEYEVPISSVVRIEAPVEEGHPPPTDQTGR
jgi:flagellar basal-body rod modification protein FlgD